MSIIKSEITEQTLLASGNYRVKFKYTLDDGREYTIGYLSANNQAHIDQLLIDKKAPLELSIKQSDAEEAQSLGLKTAYKTASQSDVYYKYLFAGYNTDDPLEAYELMEPVAQDILDIGLTIEQMAALFGETVEMAQNVFDRWTYLALNEAQILAYKTIVSGM